MINKYMNHNFCCDDMYEAIFKYKTVDYEMVLRDYGILFGKCRMQVLKFCPWCGTKLPQSLHKKIFDIIEEELGIPRLKADIFNYSNLPDEFRTDEWWKKRGL